MTVFQFTIDLPLKAQQQTRWTKSGHVYDPSSKDKEKMQWHIRPFAPEKPLEGAIELQIAFYFPIPKSVNKMLRQQMLNQVVLPCKKPDLDNLAYLVSNALKGLVYVDDKQVCVEKIFKFYGAKEKTVIVVKEILQAQDWGYHSENDL